MTKKLREIEYTEIMICLEYCKTKSICKFMNIKTGVSMIIVYVFTICNILLKVKFQSLKQKAQQKHFKNELDDLSQKHI